MYKKAQDKRIKPPATRMAIEELSDFSFGFPVKIPEFKNQYKPLKVGK